MNGQEFTDAVRDAHETPLSRLGSSKWVYALTGGEMDGDAVEEAWATEAGAAHDLFTSWADDEAADDAAVLFADVAETAADHGAAADAETPPMYETLATLEETPARVGGLLARTLVAEKTLAQMVGFFVGDADPSSANTFRDYKRAVEAERGDVEDLLDTVCDDAADWETARAAADRVIEAVYGDYVTTLESMGIKPKNVC